jgi:exosome complex RNA-binding protein Rrp4
MNSPAVKDWQGNEVKAGMIIHYVQTEISHPEMGWVVPGKGYVCTQEASKEKCWLLSGPYETFVGRNGRVWVRSEIKNGDETYTFTQPIEGIFPMKEPPMIAIKGISDQEPENVLVNGK